MSPDLGQLVSVTLQKPVSGMSKLPVRYSYSLQSCGWQPMYSFDAQPDQGDGNEIGVRLMAEVWQFTGMDWRNTKLTLASRGTGRASPLLWRAGWWIPRPSRSPLLRPGP